MRITPSSSLLLATLAISSSSSSLAAPTDAQGNDLHALSSSSSVHALARDDRMSAHIGGGNVDVGMDGQPHDSASMHSTDMPHSIHAHDRRQLGSLLGGLLDPLYEVPIVGPAIEPAINALTSVLDLLGLGSPSVTLSNDQIAQIREAASQAAENMAAALPTMTSSGKRAAARDYDDGASAYPSSTANATAMHAGNCSSTMSWPYSSSATPSFEAIALAARTPPISPPGVQSNSSNSTGPSLSPVSPPMPPNPPNTPVAPLSVPGDSEDVDVPTGASPLNPPVSPPVSPPAPPVSPPSPPVSPPAPPVSPPAPPVSLPIPFDSSNTMSATASSNNTSAATSSATPAMFDVQQMFGDSDTDTPPLFMSSTANSSSSTMMPCATANDSSLATNASSTVMASNDGTSTAAPSATPAMFGVGAFGDSESSTMDGSSSMASEFSTTMDGSSSSTMLSTTANSSSLMTSASSSTMDGPSSSVTPSATGFA